MSADLLRRAVTAIRDEHSREDVDDLDVSCFYLAVADWLAEVAIGGNERMHALAVARAYLGEQS